jgi:chaperonin GroES
MSFVPWEVRRKKGMSNIRTLIPIGSRVAIKPDTAPTSIGDILLTDHAQEQLKPQEGEIIALGPEVSVVKLGDRVLFSKYGGHEVQTDKEDKNSFVLILKEADIYCIIG